MLVRCGEKNAFVTAVNALMQTKRKQTHMLRDENAFQSYIYIHLEHLCAIVLHCMMQEVFIFTVVTLSSCVILRAAVKINSIIDDTPV